MESQSHSSSRPKGPEPELAITGEPATHLFEEQRAQAAAGAAVAVPGYKIVGELGRGGMAVVYEAHHLALQRRVALKMILVGGHAGPDHLRRFRTEAEAIARLQHPHIVQIYDMGEQGGLPYLALEYVEGGSLAERLNGAPWSPRGAARLVKTLARAMHSAHQCGIVHRDLKLGNILMTADGTPKITDFGLAKLLDKSGGPTASGVVLGTPSYMAPEQAGGKGKEAGPAADTYALGAILYELLTGRPPFQASTPLDTVLQVISAEPIPPSQIRSTVPRDLETICLKCLRKEPHERYSSAEALADDLHSFLRGEPVQARPLNAWGKMIHAGKRRLQMAKVLLGAGQGETAAGDPASIPVAVRGGTVLVDSVPLLVRPNYSSAGFLGGNVLVRRSAGCLVLRPCWKSRLLALPFLLLATFTGILGIALTTASLRSPRLLNTFQPPTPMTPLILFGILSLFCGAVGVVLLRRGRRVLFDRGAGQVIDRRFWSRENFPLREVVAVQLLASCPRIPLLLSTILLQRVTRVFQLNLILTASCPRNVHLVGAKGGEWARRINVACALYGSWAQETSRELAAFLRVPLIDLTAPIRPS